LAETYHRPVALLVTDDDGNARGSLRSIEGYHVGNALAQLDDILTKYGGHAGAG
jgi:single-stranded-DNA-specific exonuclease